MYVILFCNIYLFCYRSKILVCFLLLNSNLYLLDLSKYINLDFK